MRKIFAAFVKDLQLLWSDKVGLLLLFAMPIILVFIITIVQDSAFKIVNENKISILINNNDNKSAGKKIEKYIKNSGLFDSKITNYKSIKPFLIEIQKKKVLVGIYIPKGFTENLNEKSTHICQTIIGEKKYEVHDSKKGQIKLFFDPILTSNYTTSIEQVIKSYLNLTENEILIKNLISNLNINESPQKLIKIMTENKNNISCNLATLSKNNPIPNSTEHNVPAWTIFAMFFMVTTLGSNVTKEKLNGSFIRIKTTPTKFSTILTSKLILFSLVGLVQVFIIFGIGNQILPLIGLPKLNFPTSIFLTFITTFIIILSAISYSIMIGVLAKTQEQANGIGAISIVIFSAIGGIWVPTFVMPSYLKSLSKISPLNWSIEAYYSLFLKNGSLIELLPSLFGLIIFISICIIISFLKLKKLNIL